MKSSVFLLTLRDLAQDRFPVPSSEPGIDHQRRARADDDADVRDERDVAVRNDVGVLGQLDGRVLLDERVGRRTALSQEARGNGETHDAKRDEALE